MSDLISRCELFNRLATIPAPPEANDFKAEIYKVIQEMETEPPHVVAQINLDKNLVVEEVMQRIKDEYCFGSDWVPCTESLPEEGAECLVTDTSGCIRHCIRHDTGGYRFATVEECMHISAKAWRYAPAAYKEGDE